MKKRSLLAAVAMLLVAILAATGTTYAWFTSQSNAKAEISMSVSQGTSLEFKTDAMESYVNSANATQLGLSAASWADFSTNNTDNKFYTKTTTTVDGNQEITGYELGTPASVTLHFRSTNANDVLVKSNSSITFPTVNATYPVALAGARVTVTNDAKGTIHFATAANTNVAGIGSTSTLGAEGAFEYDTKAINAEDVAIIDLSEEVNSEGFYTGTATFSFWIEGRQVNNEHITALAENLVATLVFSQAS